MGTGGQLGDESNPNGWLFWPDGEGMLTNELAFRELTNWCEHAFQRVGDASDTLGGKPPEDDDAESGPDSR